MATTNAVVVPASAELFQYRGIARMPNGNWRSFIVNRDGDNYTIGEFTTAAAAALAHDRTILAILGPDAAAQVLNFRAAFSDTELRFLRGRYCPARCVAGVVSMIRSGTYDAELARFAEHAFDTYTEPELAHDVANFRAAHSDALRRRRKEEALATVGGNNVVDDPAARAKAERDVERAAFLKAAKNKATDGAWVESYLSRRRRQFGLTLEDENRWPLVVPPADNIGDWPPGQELIYLPNGSSYVDEMMLKTELTKK